MMKLTVGWLMKKGRERRVIPGRSTSFSEYSPCLLKCTLSKRLEGKEEEVEEKEGGGGGEEEEEERGREGGGCLTYLP